MLEGLGGSGVMGKDEEGVLRDVEDGVAAAEPCAGELRE